MTDKNANKIGYKKTKLGWIPEDWDVMKSGNLFCNYSKKNNSNEELLSVTQDKGVIPRTMVETRIAMPEGSTLSYKLVEKGDFVISLRSFQGGIEYSKYRGIVSPAYTILKNKKNIVAGYYKQWFKSSEFIARLRVAIIGIRDGKQISYDDFSMIPICYPSLNEQEKIAEVLSCWDDGIEVLEKLLEKKQLHKKALMQRLYSRKKTKFDKKIYKLGQLFTNRKETNCTNLELLSVCDGVGIIPRSQLNAKDNSNEDKSKYLKVCIGDIAYNTMRMWQGRCGVSNYVGIVSPAYTVCIPTEKINVNYMYYMFKTPHMIHDFWRFSQGIVEDTLNLKFNNFSIIKVEIPTKEVQQKIAEILNNCDEEIRLLDKKLEMLKLQKKGLMQKLLTGEIRVKEI